MPKAFVTGANGFLGLNLVEQLVASGWTVVGMCLPHTDVARLARFPATIVEGDITVASSVETAMPESLDAVFHTAAMTSIWARLDEVQTRVNVEGTRNVARASLRKGARRLVHTSTWNTYGASRAAISEETPQTGHLSRVNYVRSKALAEEEVRNAAADGLAAVILNPAHLIGRYDAHNWGRIIRKIRDGRLFYVPRAAGPFCHAEAVALAHVAAAEKGRPGENYLLPGVVASFLEIVIMLGEISGMRVPSRTIPTPILRLFARAQAAIAGVTGRPPDLTPEGVELMLHNPRIATDKAARELGYRPAPLREMLVDAYSWMEREGFASG